MISYRFNIILDLQNLHSLDPIFHKQETGQALGRTKGHWNLQIFCEDKLNWNVGLTYLPKHVLTNSSTVFW